GRSVDRRSAAADESEVERGVAIDLEPRNRVEARLGPGGNAGADADVGARASGGRTRRAAAVSVTVAVAGSVDRHARTRRLRVAEHHAAACAGAPGEAHARGAKQGRA